MRIEGSRVMIRGVVLLMVTFGFSPRESTAALAHQRIQARPGRGHAR